MDVLDLVQLNLLSPVVLAFLLGVLATLVRSDLRFPEALYASMSIYLLLAIGLKGGAELAKTPLAEVWRPGLIAIALSAATPVWTYLILRKLGRFDVPNAAALAAHYGSVSAVTFFASVAFLDAARVPHEGFLPALLAVMEFPAILIALVLARLNQPESTRWGEVFHEILSGRSILLLLGGLVIGLVAGKWGGGISSVAPLFVAPFQGVLMLFLLEMGMVAANRLREIGKAGFFLVGFGVTMPILHGMLGVWLGHLCGLSMGGSVILGTLASSASYIAAPAAVRIALPQANPGYYLTAAIGITFPFNLTCGIPLYYAAARWVFGA